MSRILIIEDRYDDFEFIYKALLKSKFSLYSEIFPLFRSKRAREIVINDKSYINYKVEFQFCQTVFKQSMMIIGMLLLNKYLNYLIM